MFEKFYGTAFVYSHIYTSPWVIALWVLVSCSAMVYIMSKGLYRRFITFALHISFLLILTGAVVTHFFALSGRVHLREGAPPTTVLELAGGELARFPFQLSLQQFRLEYYLGTFAPMDYVSSIAIVDDDGKCEGVVSMNNIFSYKNWRFYQSGYDADCKGAVLSVSYDPYGIGITYAGYISLFLSMLLFFFQKKSLFRSLLKSDILRKGGVALILLFFSNAVKADEQPRTLPCDVAEEFGNLYVYYNDRICPMQTLAKDFTVKICGKSTYRGLSPEQVLTGWFFYYDEWKHEPMIKVKDGEIRMLLGVAGEYASLADFNDVNGYKLQDVLKNSRDLALYRAANAANEKYNLISMACVGSLMKIFPMGGTDTPVWYSPADTLPENIPNGQSLFVKSSLRVISEKVATGDYDEVLLLLGKIREYQHREVKALLPSDARFAAEKLYNSANYVRPLAMICVVLGVICFVLYCRKLIAVTPSYPAVHLAMLIFIAATFLYLTMLMGVRGYISRHLPLSNGYETMVMMAWCSSLFTLLLRKRFFMAVPFGLLLCGLALMVAMLGDTNPQITNLMPVLQSPLLSIHVVVIMISYSLLAFAMLNGVTAIVLSRSKESGAQIEYLAVVSRLMFYPAVFLLAIGIFVGAVWANVSWGRYWGWDPKEVWALITMLVYSFALHSVSLSPFRNPMFVHLFSVVAFLTVIITYFGVNFILGGMHSYA